MSAIVITGLGALGSFGAGRTALGEAWARGSVPVTSLEDPAAFNAPATTLHAACMDPIALRECLPSGGSIRRMSHPSKLMLAASLASLRDGGLEPATFAGPRAGLYFGSHFGPVNFTETILTQILDTGPLAASPMLFPECVANAPTGQVAIHCGARGPNFTFLERELNGITPLVHAFGQLGRGRCDRALVGSGGEMTTVLHAALLRLRCLAPAGPDGRPQPAPFDARRSGILAAEGATVLVLEREDEAARRGARAHARVLAGGLAFDPSATRVGWGTGADALAGALCAGLDRAGLPLESIGAICSGASGSRAGDLLEARLIRKAWRERTLPPVLVPKATFGEYSSAPLAAAVLLLEPMDIGAVPGFTQPDPACGISPWAGRRHEGADRVLLLACAAGGGMGWVVIERPA